MGSRGGKGKSKTPAVAYLSGEERGPASNPDIGRPDRDRYRVSILGSPHSQERLPVLLHLWFVGQRRGTTGGERRGRVFVAWGSPVGRNAVAAGGDLVIGFDFCRNTAEAWMEQWPSAQEWREKGAGVETDERGGEGRGRGERSPEEGKDEFLYLYTDVCMP